MAFRSLQDHAGDSRYADTNGYWPAFTAMAFPGVFAEPQVAWIHFVDSGQFVQLGELRVEKTNARSELEKLIADTNAAGFTEVRFVQIISDGFVQHSHLDVVKLFPGFGDGRYWFTPADQYQTQMTLNKETLGLKR
ncbi:MAG: hypothetical protein R3C03_02045 [Pirellulaceae bacterium]